MAAYALVTENGIEEASLKKRSFPLTIGYALLLQGLRFHTHS